MPEQWEIRTGQNNRRVFAGTEEDARAYMERNFPRMHAEPGNDYGDEGPTPDATLTAPNGERHHYRGSEGWVNLDAKDEPEDTPDDNGLGDGAGAVDPNETDPEAVI